MNVRFPLRTVSLAIALASLTGCGDDDVSAVETVELGFSANMTSEITSQPSWSGDPDGTGVALITINADKRELCWEIGVARILLPATASHIHKAAPGVRGSIVVTLSAPDAAGVARGCAANVDAALLA